MRRRGTLNAEKKKQITRRKRKKKNKTFSGDEAKPTITSPSKWWEGCTRTTAHCRTRPGQGQSFEEPHDLAPDQEIGCMRGHTTFLSGLLPCRVSVSYVACRASRAAAATVGTSTSKQAAQVPLHRRCFSALFHPFFGPPWRSLSAQIVEQDATRLAAVTNDSGQLDTQRGRFIHANTTASLKTAIVLSAQACLAIRDISHTLKHTATPLASVSAPPPARACLAPSKIA